MLTVRETAERLGAAASSVRLWANNGRFAGAKLMGDADVGVTYWLIPESALESFQKQKPGPKGGRPRKGAVTPVRKRTPRS